MTVQITFFSLFFPLPFGCFPPGAGSGGRNAPGTLLFFLFQQSPHPAQKTEAPLSLLFSLPFFLLGTSEIQVCEGK